MINDIFTNVVTIATLVNDEYVNRTITMEDFIEERKNDQVNFSFIKTHIYKIHENHRNVLLTFVPGQENPNVIVQTFKEGILINTSI